MQRTSQSKILRLFPALLLTLAACTPQEQQLVSAPAAAPVLTPAQSEEAVWAFEESDLPFDPAFRVGRLDNGLRYVIRQNATPAGQGQVRLFVDAGSMAETANELGFAHFIEHMAFNGSTNVPEGEMIKLLEREGLAFGADTNASTSLDYTLYKLDLPRNDPELLDTALMLMRETASELTFDQAAVDREKGVVLSERRVRDTYALRNLLDSLDFLYPDAYFAQRMPIGKIETLETASAPVLKALWQRIYTPENSAIIVVGDFDPALVEAEIVEHFADWPSSTTPPKLAEGPVDFSLSGQTDIYIDPALAERVTAARNQPWIDEPDTAETRRINLLRRIGYGVVNRRFQRIANGENPPFRSAGYGTSEVFEAGRTTNLIIDAGDGEWRAGLTAAIIEYRRALEFGFSVAEVAEQLANIRTSIENTAATADTRSNSSHTAAAIALVQNDIVPTTPASTLERFEAIVPDVTPETVLAAMLADAAPLDEPLLRFEGRTAPEGGAEALRAVWDAAMTTEVERGDQQENAEFAYTDFGTPGAIVTDSVDPRLGIRQLRFANGLRLNLKPTDLKKDRVLFELNIDGGNMLDTRENPLATAMTSSLPRGGLGQHSYDELHSILAGRSVSFSIRSDEVSFVMASTTTSRDLELQLQLLAATLVDPGFRAQGETQYRRGVANFFARQNATPNNALNNAMGAIISDDDPRFSLQSEEGFLALTFSKLREDIGDRLTNGALELALVGEFDEDEAIALVAKTLGALPTREPKFLAYSKGRERSFTAERKPRTIRHDGEVDQAVLRFIWPTRDDSDLREHMTLELLERIVRLELTDVLREALGQTYSPTARAGQSHHYKGYGTFYIAAAIDTGQVDATREAMIATIAKLRGAAVDDDTLLRARQPMIEAYDNALKANRGYIGLVDQAQSDPDSIDRFLAGPGILKSLTSEDIRAAAARYLDPAQRLEAVVLPELSEPAGDE